MQKDEGYYGSIMDLLWIYHLYGNGVHGSNDGTPTWQLEREVCGVVRRPGLPRAGTETETGAHVREFSTNLYGRRTPPRHSPAGDSLGLSDTEKEKAGGSFGTKQAVR